MKISKITLAEYKPQIKKQNTKNTQNSTISNPINTGYRDFNINFRGRTPENFYEQDFNIKFMPDTMKKFLNADYEVRKHIPPEQVMSESFKYLAITDNFADVKSTYPDEPLFNNLHEASLKGRTGILSDIKLAKEMSDTPLFNDGCNDLGIYLLRKIYLEGKTIKEINKDFYEKDLNPAYKGIITQPVTYGTTSAYGIQYPKTDFWNSFIATREEYKKFFVNLPKQNKVELKKELAELHQPKTYKTEKPKPRKYTIKKYQKEQIKRDILKSKGDENAIKNAITRRFKNDDPEAAFIVKYLSPVMAVAADKIHLSEEMKFFAESIKENGKKADNLFAQFWKANPKLLEHYSTAITDTIDLFEETYESGGVLPINNEYQIITQDTKNQKPIDFVPQRFVELLDYTQTIAPNREKIYAAHNEEQKKWEEHFLWRYGEQDAKQPVEETPQKSDKTPLDLLQETADANNARVYTLKGINGEMLHITANLDETLGDYIKREYIGFPPRFVNLVIKRALKDPFMTEKAKLSFAAAQIEDKIDDENILNKTERRYILNSVVSGMRTELATASMATLDILASYTDEPQRIYRTMAQVPSDRDVSEYSTALLKAMSEEDFDKKTDSLYSLYKKPLANNEIVKITHIIMDYIRNFDAKYAATEQSVFCNNQEFIKGLTSFKERFNLNTADFKRGFKQVLRNEIAEHIQKNNFGRTLLIQDISAKQLTAKTEAYISIILNSMLDSAAQKHKL